jgi:methylmalonyl-CoA mutase N-terminal domain/subunit
MTDKLEAEAREYIRKIDEMGGMVSAVERGYPQREISASAYRFQRQVDRGEKVVVGVNSYKQQAERSRIPLLRVDETVQRDQMESLAKVKRERDQDRVRNALAAIAETARGDANLMPPMIDAAKAYCSEQEICDVLREVFGQHSDRPEF